MHCTLEDLPTQLALAESLLEGDATTTTDPYLQALHELAQPHTNYHLTTKQRELVRIYGFHTRVEKG